MTSEQSNLEIVDRSRGRATTRLSGDLDIVTSEEVKRDLAQLIDDGTRSWRSTSRASGSSTPAAWACSWRCTATPSRGAAFVVRSVPPQVQRLFEITRLGDLLTVDGD